MSNMRAMATSFATNRLNPSKGYARFGCLQPAIKAWLICWRATLSALSPGVFACSRSQGINAKCDGRHRLPVRHVTAPAEVTRHRSTIVNQRNMEAGMLLRNFVRLTSATIVVAVTLLFAVPFVLALVSPFIGK